MYTAARPLQGRCIAVCLGLLDLEGRPYYLPAPNHLTQFLLLSCGGIRLSCEPKLLPPVEAVISSIENGAHEFTSICAAWRYPRGEFPVEYGAAMCYDH
jgi:hypothetical protein